MPPGSSPHPLTPHYAHRMRVELPAAGRLKEVVELWHNACTAVIAAGAGARVKVREDALGSVRLDNFAARGAGHEEDLLRHEEDLLRRGRERRGHRIVWRGAWLDHFAACGAGHEEDLLRRGRERRGHRIVWRGAWLDHFDACGAGHEEDLLSGGRERRGHRIVWRGAWLDYFAACGAGHEEDLHMECAVERGQAREMEWVVRLK
eukprot:364742-Chlamydomonas_euryale.AAC.3